MKRRRLLQIAAAAGLIAASPARAFRLDPVEWRGTALGAAASLIIHHEDRGEAMRLVGQCRAEIERLERALSLYRDDSALVRLNREGRLDAPPVDLVAVLGLAGRFWHQTGGAFDPTVQRVWEAHARHFLQIGADPAGPSPDVLERARAAIGWPKVRVSPERVELGSGMALTLNGIAQGYVTDRITGLLRHAGMRHVLVNMGEIAVIGERGDARPWRVKLPDGSVTDLSEGALAVSHAEGVRFSPSCHHIFDPSTGRSARRRDAVIIRAESAAAADALSTAAAAQGDP